MSHTVRHFVDYVIGLFHQMADELCIKKKKDRKKIKRKIKPLFFEKKKFFIHLFFIIENCTFYQILIL